MSSVPWWNLLSIHQQNHTASEEMATAHECTESAQVMAEINEALDLANDESECSLVPFGSIGYLPGMVEPQNGNP